MFDVHPTFGPYLHPRFPPQHNHSDLIRFQLVIEMTNSTAKITHMPRPKDDPSQRRPDISLAKKNLNWEPKVSLKEGLSKTIDFFRTIDLKQYRKPTDHTAHKSSEL